MNFIVRKRFVVPLAAFLVIIGLFLTWTNIGGFNSEKQKIKRILEIALISHEISDYNLIKDKQNIILSSENIKPELIPKLKGINITILSPSGIKQRANKEGEFLYLKFSNIDISNKVATLSLDNIWAAPDNINHAYTSGGGMTITFHKIFGKWIEDKTREAWIA